MKCFVCESLDHKYKCPKCRIPYCSLDCWKIHKSKSCEPAIPKEYPNSDVVKSDVKIDQSQYRFPTEDTVPIEKLKLLEKSEGLLRVLENPHVRDILNMVDRSPNPGQAIHSAMLEPIFVEFADECFKIIEPSES